MKNIMAPNENSSLLPKGLDKYSYESDIKRSRSNRIHKRRASEDKTSQDLVPEPVRGTKLYIIACILCFVAAFLRALSMAASQILDDTVGEFELNIGRFGSMYLVVMPIYFFKRCPSMTVNVNQIVPIIIMSLFYFAMNITTYAAATYIAVGTSNVVIIISFMIIILLTSIVNTLISKAAWTWRPVLTDSICIILLCLGVMFMIQPHGIFGGHTRFVTYKSYCNPNRFGNMTAYEKNLTASGELTQIRGHNTSDICYTIPDPRSTVIPSWKGYVYSITAGAFNSFRVTTAKRIFKTEDNHVVSIWMASFNTVLSVICTALFQNFTLPHGPLCIFSLIGHATTTGTMTILIITAMKWIPSTDLTLMHSFTPLFLFIFQFTFLAKTSPTPAPQNAMAVGSAICMSIVILSKPVYEIVYHNHQKKKEADEKT